MTSDLPSAGGVERLAPEPASARHARALVLAVLRQAAQPRADVTGVGEVAALLTSELATNAVRHARSPFEVRATLRGDRLRVEVEDADPRLPARREPGLADTCGRGIMLVDTLADAWGTEPSGAGKAVWFELTCPSRSGDRPQAVRSGANGSAAPSS